MTVTDNQRHHDGHDEALSALARSLHREWDSPELWPSIADGMRAVDAEVAARHTDEGWRATGRWKALAAAAVIVVALGPTSWLGWRWFMLGPKPEAAAVQQQRQRLLTEDALAAIERSEAQYIEAIDELSRLAAPRLDMPDSPLLVNLRDRLEAIDMAIAEYRAEIDRNRFNAHLRQQLLWIYQEKRHTLEQVQEYTPDAL